MEQVIVQKIDISLQGELQSFQVRIPRKIKKIIGVETGLRIVEVLPTYTQQGNFERFGIRRNRMMGELKLQSLDNCNFFYTKEVFDEDRSIDNDAIEIFDSPKRRSPFPEFMPLEVPEWMPLFSWTHGYRLEEDPVLIGENAVISGTYKDFIGRDYKINPVYKVMLYIWCSTD
jgi:hypothetical protein